MVARAARWAVTAGLMLAVVPEAFAQADGAASAREAMKSRSNLSIMEGVLERAVILGANNLNQRVRAVTPQDVLLLTGEARVRGFRLHGYGLFFDVEVPVLRQSVAWSLQALLDQGGLPLTAAVSQLRAYVNSVTDLGARRSLEVALRRLELQVYSTRTGIAPASGAPVVAQGFPAIPTAALAWLADPNGAYTAEVKSALMDAMLEHSGALMIGPDEWLTAAARDNGPRDHLNPSDDVRSIVLRVKGRDLAALRAGRLSLDEARSRVEVRQE